MKTKAFVILWSIISDFSENPHLNGVMNLFFFSFYRDRSNRSVDPDGDGFVPDRGQPGSLPSANLFYDEGPESHDGTNTCK